MKKLENSCNFTIESLGGTGGYVTGSSHVVEDQNSHSKLMVDAGLFQGRDQENFLSRNGQMLQRFKFRARGVSQILITHPHIDHTGSVPEIFRDGLTPSILATEETAAFMEPMLMNSADIQSSSRDKGGKLYGRSDVERALKHIKVVKAFVENPVGQRKSGITAEFLPNGHVMGSVSITIRSPDGKTNILFTGDMGKEVQSLCGGYENYISRYPKYPIDTMVVESTNFERNPIPFKEKQENFFKTIKDIWSGGGNPLLLTLSFHRTQEIMEMIHNGQKKGVIPSDCQIVIDAPLAMSLLETFKELGPTHLSRGYGNNPNYYKSDKSSLERFQLQNIAVIQSHLDSKRSDNNLAYCSGKKIIIASGGMGGFGRGVNYVRGKFCSNPKNAVVLTCYQVEGTEGSKLLKDGRVIRKDTESGAKVVKVEGFTSHASGPEEVFHFLESFNLSQLKRVVITHGQDSAREAMASEFKRRGYPAEIILSRIGQVIEV